MKDEKIQMGSPCPTHNQPPPLTYKKEVKKKRELMRGPSLLSSERTMEEFKRKSQGSNSIKTAGT